MSFQSRAVLRSDAITIGVWEQDDRTTVTAVIYDQNADVLRDEDCSWHGDDAFSVLAEALDELRFIHARNINIIFHSDNIYRWLFGERLSIKPHEPGAYGKRKFPVRWPKIRNDPKWIILHNLFSYRRCHLQANEAALAKTREAWKRGDVLENRK